MGEPVRAGPLRAKLNPTGIRFGYAIRRCMIPDSKVLDAPPHGVSIEQTVEMGKDFELLVLFTSTPVSTWT